MGYEERRERTKRMAVKRSDGKRWKRWKGEGWMDA
jgi:hypothetical protein